MHVCQLVSALSHLCAFGRTSGEKGRAWFCAETWRREVSAVNMLDRPALPLPSGSRVASAAETASCRVIWGHLPWASKMEAGTFVTEKGESCFGGRFPEESRAD